MKFLWFYIFLFFSCATSYQERGFTGGYNELKINNDIYQISFYGNSYTSSDLVNKYFLRRCAEVTLENGYEYFIFLDQNTDLTIQNFSNPHVGLLNKTSSGDKNNSAPYNNYRINRLSKVGIIKMLNTGNQLQTAINAKEFLNNLKLSK
jgi:hypothetical protein